MQTTHSVYFFKQASKCSPRNACPWTVPRGISLPLRSGSQWVVDLHSLSVLQKKTSPASLRTPNTSSPQQRPSQTSCLSPTQSRRNLKSQSPIVCLTNNNVRVNKRLFPTAKSRSSRMVPLPLLHPLLNTVHWPRFCWMPLIPKLLFCQPVSYSLAFCSLLSTWDINPWGSTRLPRPSYLHYFS